MVTAQSAVSPFQQFLEEGRKEYEQVQAELKEIDMLIQQTTAEVDRLAQRHAQHANRLRQVEAIFDSVPREDIHEAYTAVQEAQQRLFTMRGQLEKLQSDQKHLDRYARLLRRLLDLGRLDEITLQGAMEDEEGESTPPVVRVIEAQEQERQRLARQMHDGPAQALTNLVLQAEICERLFDVDSERARVELANLKAAVGSTFQRVKGFITNLRPMMLDDLGLIPTLRRYVEDFKENSGISVNLTVTGRERRFASYKEVTIFRAVQELLNVARELSHATNVQVTVDLGDDRVLAAVEDNGSGFDIAEVLSGPAAEQSGLAVLRERVEMLEGHFQIESNLGRGTRVALEIPLP
jgi:two-component system sensor histidine kinase DegS